MFSGHKEDDNHFYRAASGDRSWSDLHLHHVPALISNDHTMNGTRASYVVVSGDHTIGGIQGVYVPALICNDHDQGDTPFRVVVTSGDH